MLIDPLKWVECYVTRWAHETLKHSQQSVTNEIVEALRVRLPQRLDTEAADARSHQRAEDRTARSASKRFEDGPGGSQGGRTVVRICVLASGGAVVGRIPSIPSFGARAELALISLQINYCSNVTASQTLARWSHSLESEGGDTHEYSAGGHETKHLAASALASASASAFVDWTSRARHVLTI